MAKFSRYISADYIGRLDYRSYSIILSCQIFQYSWREEGDRGKKWDVISGHATKYPPSEQKQTKVSLYSGSFYDFIPYSNKKATAARVSPKMLVTEWRPSFLRCQGWDVLSNVSNRTKRTYLIWICIWFGDTKSLYLQDFKFHIFWKPTSRRFI